MSLTKALVLLVVVLAVALVVIFFLGKSLHKARRKNKLLERNLGMRHKNLTDLREAVKCNSRLVKENLDLRALVGADRIKNIIPRTTFGQGTVLPTECANNVLKFKKGDRQ